MQLMLHVQPDAARMLRHHRAESSACADLLRKARKLGVTLRPLRTGSEDSALASGFTVEVPDMDTAERIAEELRDCDVVESAYFVPADELP